MALLSWKSLFILFILLMSSTLMGQSFDFGNGALGACTQATFATGGTYQCASVSILAPATVVGGGVLRIKCTGTVTIAAALTVNGQNGAGGGALQTGNVALGGNAGPGGFAGGSCDDANGCLPPDNNGSGAGSGGGGGTYSGFGGGIGGGGGGGGAYGVAGSVGVKGVTVDGGNAGVAGSTFGSESNFENSFTGGAGGAAGGIGQDGGLNNILGAGGGGGGGAIRIEAAGEIHITVAGSITANGGNGGAGTSVAPNGPGGGGGGGAGGAIFLQSATSITLDAAGLLTVAGGTGGAGQGAGDGDGGAGGRGRIRLDDADGVVLNSPAFAVVNVLSSRSSGQQLLKSSIGCGSIGLSGDDGNPPGPSLFFFFIFSLVFGFILSKVFVTALKN